jgi:hypothetical protein
MVCPWYSLVATAFSESMVILQTGSTTFIVPPVSTTRIRIVSLARQKGGSREVEVGGMEKGQERGNRDQKKGILRLVEPLEGPRWDY